MLPKIPVAMVTWRFQNGCIFPLFLRYFKFLSVKVFKNLMLNLEYEMEQYIKNEKNYKNFFRYLPFSVLKKLFHRFF